MNAHTLRIAQVIAWRRMNPASPAPDNILIMSDEQDAYAEAANRSCSGTAVDGSAVATVIRDLAKQARTLVAVENARWTDNPDFDRQYALEELQRSVTHLSRQLTAIAVSLH